MELPAGVHSVRWVDWDEGDKLDDKICRIALPYIVVVHHLRSCLTGWYADNMDLFFRNEPLQSMDDKLFVPVMHNCMFYRGCSLTQDGKPLDRSYSCGISSHGETLVDVISKTKTKLFGSQFNDDGDSNYDEVRELPRFRKIATIEDWEKNTAKDPRFILKMKWPRTNATVRRLFDCYIPRYPSQWDTIVFEK